jgi:hypothetical protein
MEKNCDVRVMMTAFTDELPPENKFSSIVIHPSTIIQ